MKTDAAMPGITKYSLVDDAHDLRLPVHNDEVFKHGVCFEAKVSGACNRWQEFLRTGVTEDGAVLP